jgi:hypothetical protein
MRSTACDHVRLIVTIVCTRKVTAPVVLYWADTANGTKCQGVTSPWIATELQNCAVSDSLSESWTGMEQWTHVVTVTRMQGWKYLPVFPSHALCFHQTQPSNQRPLLSQNQWRHKRNCSRAVTFFHYETTDTDRATGINEETEKQLKVSEKYLWNSKEKSSQYATASHKCRPMTSA